MNPKQNHDNKLINNDISDIEATAPNPQVSSKRVIRRRFSSTYKLRVLKHYDACESSLERGEFLRKEGLYQGCVSKWRRDFEQGKLTEKKGDKKGHIRADHLTRENHQLKKKLAQAEAIIELQKKVSELLGEHILPIDKS
jgi:transposase